MDRGGGRGLSGAHTTSVEAALPHAHDGPPIPHSWWWLQVLTRSAPALLAAHPVATTVRMVVMAMVASRKSRKKPQSRAEQSLCL